MYLKSILITLVLSQLILVLASEFWGEHTQKLLRIVCGTVMILIVFSPVKGIVEYVRIAVLQVLEESETAEEPETSKQQTEAVMEASCAYIAEEWFTYITEMYGIKRSQIRLIFQTDEDMRILSAKIILMDCPYAIRRKIEQEMASETDITILVEGE